MHWTLALTVYTRFAQHSTEHGTTAWPLDNSVLCFCLHLTHSILKIHKEIMTGVIYDPSLLAPSQPWKISSSLRRSSSCSTNGSAARWVGMTTEGPGPTPWKWKGNGQLVRLEVWLAGLMSASKNILPAVWTLPTHTRPPALLARATWERGLNSTRGRVWKSVPDVFPEQGVSGCHGTVLHNLSEHRQHQFLP